MCGARGVRGIKCPVREGRALPARAHWLARCQEVFPESAGGGPKAAFTLSAPPRPGASSVWYPPFPLLWFRGAHTGSRPTDRLRLLAGSLGYLLVGKESTFSEVKQAASAPNVPQDQGCRQSV